MLRKTKTLDEISWWNMRLRSQIRTVLVAIREKGNRNVRFFILTRSIAFSLREKLDWICNNETYGHICSLARNEKLL